MQIYRRSLSSAAQLSELYNQQTAKIPACFPQTPHAFQQGVRCQPTPTYPYSKLQLEADQLIIGEKNGRIVGFAHVAKLHKETLSGDTSHVGLIRFLAYQPDHRALGQLILTSAETYCRELELHTIEAFAPASYPFYCLNSRSLSAKMIHVLALLGLNDYQIIPKYFFMGYDLTTVQLHEPTLPTPKLKVALIQSQGQGNLPNLRVQLWHESTLIGRCNTASVGAFCQAKAAQDRAYTSWIKVETAAREQGLARYLIQKSCFELQQIGYHYLYADVRYTNYKAQLLHQQAGYQLLDTKYYALKQLTQ